MWSTSEDGTREYAMCILSSETDACVSEPPFTCPSASMPTSPATPAALLSAPDEVPDETPSHAGPLVDQLISPEQRLAAETVVGLASLFVSAVGFVVLCSIGRFAQFAASEAKALRLDSDGDVMS